MTTKAKTDKKDVVQTSQKSETEAAATPSTLRPREEIVEQFDVPLRTILSVEQRFPCVRSFVDEAGQHYYDAPKLALLKRIVDMHYRQGFTFRGVQNFLDSQGIACEPEEVEKGEDVMASSKRAPKKPIKGQGELHISVSHNQKQSLHDFIPRLETLLAMVQAL